MVGQVKRIKIHDEMEKNIWCMQEYHNLKINYQLATKLKREILSTLLYQR
jgi:hypothetical protein